MKTITYTRLVGIFLGLTVILACSFAGAAVNGSESNALSPTEMLGSGILQEKIQKFTDDSAAESATYVGTKDLPSGKMYEFETKSGRFGIDAKTGEVETAIIKGSIVPNSITANNFDGVKSQAQSFVEENYPNFMNRTMVLSESRIIDHGDAGKEYYFVWNEMAGDAYTQNVVQFSVFPEWNNTITYIGIDRPLLIDTKPNIPQNVARAKTLGAFGLSAGAQVSSKLVVVPNGDGQKLIWVVDATEQKKDLTYYGGTALIDAVTGNVLSVYPIQ